MTEIKDINIDARTFAVKLREMVLLFNMFFIENN